MLRRARVYAMCLSVLHAPGVALCSCGSGGATDSFDAGSDAPSYAGDARAPDAPAGDTSPSATDAGPSTGPADAPLPRADAAPAPTDATAPPTSWINATGNLATLAAGGGDISIVSAKPDSARVIAGVGQKGLFATDDSGTTWFALGTGAGSTSINNDPTAITYDPAQPTTFWESGIYGSAVFKTTDNGQTFAQLGSISHSDLVSVDFTDPARAVLLAGPHEQAQKLYLSRDGGATWTDIGPNLPPNTNFSTLPLVLDSRTFLVGSCGWGSGACGVFRSTDGGGSWTVVDSDGPVARPLWASDGTIYWALANNAGILVSADRGQTWTKSQGPVSLYYSTSPAELPDGRVVTLGMSHLLATTDHGKTWNPIGDPLPFPGANCGTYGLTYSAWTKTFFINHNDCSGHVATSSVYSAGFDYTTQ
jgi:photosystem II stability/assembly factor-like uncharacterized protein